MKKKIANIGIIGCGRIAGHHCRAIKNNDNLKLTAVCDLDKDKAKLYQDEYNTIAFDNYHEMLETNPEIDTVAIITPSGMHFEHSIDILGNYKKNIIVEKPTFLRTSDFNIIQNLLNQNNLKLYPIFQNRHNNAVKRVKKAITEKELGEIRIVSVRVRWCRPQRYYDLSEWRGTYAMDGGCLTNQGIHHLDLMRYLGGPISSVSARMDTMGSNIEVEDVVVGNVEYENGALGSVEITTAARPDDFEASISIVGSKGLAQIGGIAVNELQLFTPNPIECSKHSEDFSGNVYGNGHDKIYEEIVKDISNISPFSVSVNDAFNTVKLLNSFYVSNEKNKIIIANDSEDSSFLGRIDDSLLNVYRSKK